MTEAARVPHAICPSPKIVSVLMNDFHLMS